jgi:hypothetical protein
MRNITPPRRDETAREHGGYFVAVFDRHGNKLHVGAPSHGVSECPVRLFDDAERGYVAVQFPDYRVPETEGVLLKNAQLVEYDETSLARGGDDLRAVDVEHVEKNPLARPPDDRRETRVGLADFRIKPRDVQFPPPPRRHNPGDESVGGDARIIEEAAYRRGLADLYISREKHMAGHVNRPPRLLFA